MLDVCVAQFCASGSAGGSLDREAGWVSGQLGVRSAGFQVSWVSGQLGVRSAGCQVSWVSGQLGVRSAGCQVSWVSGQLGCLLGASWNPLGGPRGGLLGASWGPLGGLAGARAAPEPQKGQLGPLEPPPGTPKKAWVFEP